MEQYKEKLKTDNIILSICIVILAAFSLLGFAAEAEWFSLTPTAGDSHWQSMWRGFMSGAALGLLGLMLFGLISNLLAMKDEKKLRKLYIKTNDERQTQLFQNARSTAMSIFLIFGLIAVIVTGYFSVTVSMTLLICVLFRSSLCLWLKIYYSKKY